MMPLVSIAKGRHGPPELATSRVVSAVPGGDGRPPISSADSAIQGVPNAESQRVVSHFSGRPFVSISFRSLTAVCLATLLAGLPSRLLADDVAIPRVVGVAGCTAASCHGGKSLVGGEATAWLTRDTAHRRAFDVLFNETSVRMAKQLGLKAAHTEARCLACHSTAAAHPSAVKGERFAVEFGVGCESCHGAAGAWVARHTERTWRSLSMSQKADLGFHDLRPVNARAEKCAECHAGSPRATVDHDLIAAGHPRLAFELSAYHALLPKHWDTAAELQRDPAQELRLWAIGHAVSAKALSDVAIARAEAAKKSGMKHVTPDLAEFDCHACHHDLAEPTRDRPTLRDSLGSPRWGSWSVPPARIAARESHRLFGQDGTAAESSLGQLAKLMQQSRLGLAPTDQLSLAARQSSADLADWSRLLEYSTTEPERMTQLLHRLIATESDSEWLPTWDGQAQRYLGIVATSRALRVTSGREPFSFAANADVLAKLRRQLAYPVGYATPRSFDPTAVNHAIQELRQSLAR